MGENATSLSDFRTMVAMGAADFVQPSIVKMGGVTAMMTVAREAEAAGAVCVPNAFYVGPGFLAAVHCMAVKEKASPLERLFADLGAVPFAKTVPVVNGGIDVPVGPGLGADPEPELIERFRV
jgi:L-alanine-DL-glutamate epimerase-like enolase superfamily enzyme